MTTWTPNLPLFKPSVGLHLVTVRLYDGRQPVGAVTRAANFHHDGHWLGVADDDVIAWADLPEPYDGRTPPDEWQYDEDTGTVMCRCPQCGGRLIISYYQYNNPYRYCPFCGEALSEGKIAAKRQDIPCYQS